MKQPAGPRWLYYRGYVQFLSALLANSYFLSQLKGFCYPVLNCWACPAANFACPVGALQYATIGARRGLTGVASLAAVLPLYVLGTLVLFSALFGRMMCGWLCPFGWLQDLLGRLRRNKLKTPRWAGYTRYAVLVGLVFVTPYYTGVAWFTKLCPQGALQGGIFQPLLYPELRASIHSLWYLKQGILLATLVAMIFIRRPFCGIVCPLGAIFSLFNRHSAWQIKYDADRCTNCMWFAENCPAAIDPREEANGHSCISCLECQKCPYEAIHSQPSWRRQPCSEHPDQAMEDVSTTIEQTWAELGA